MSETLSPLKSAPKQRVIALIPARGGSVSIPKKNIKPLAGRPLIDWVIKPAIHSGIFAEIYVSTDDGQIAKIAEECGAKVHWRAPETATSTASTESAILDFVNAHPNFDILCLIQATSPFIAPDDFIQGMELMETAEADSLVTAVRTHRFLWSIDGKTQEATAKNYDPIKRPRRQDWNGELIENGAFYLTRKAVLQKHKCRLGGKMVCLEMPEHTLTELDSLIDWQIVDGMSQEFGFWPPAMKRARSMSLNTITSRIDNDTVRTIAMVGASLSLFAMALRFNSAMALTR